MGNRRKAFDCVEMKREAQREIEAEYEARRDEFSSYAEFLEATIGESDWASSVWARFGGNKAEARAR